MTTITERVTQSLAYLNNFDDGEGKNGPQKYRIRSHSKFG